jgi:importin-7
VSCVAAAALSAIHLEYRALSLFVFLHSLQNFPSLIHFLQTLVARFGPDLAPYAVNVMSALVQQFWQAVAEEEEDQDEADPFGGGGALAGYSLLGAMETVLDAVSSVPELYPQMEDLLFPILERYISQEGLEIFEEASEDDKKNIIDSVPRIFFGVVCILCITKQK